MSRRIASRIRIKGWLIAEGPLHVGGMGGNEDVDLMIAIDGMNQPYIPGTSLAGVLRAWLRERMDDQKVDFLFGPPQERNSDQGHASYVLIEDGTVSLQGQLLDQVIEIRDGVGIDRNSGTAADRTKYERAVLPLGTRIGFEMAVEVHDRRNRAEMKRDSDETHEEFESRQNEVKSIVGALLQALQSEGVHLGGAKSRGHGLVKLESGVDIYLQELKSPAGVIHHLKNSHQGLSIDELKPSEVNLASVPQIIVSIDWEPDGPLMVKASREGVAVDMLPLTTKIGDERTLLLPGSSIKGALRSQAERIVRTLIPSLHSRERFLDQVDVPLVTDLFGEAGKASTDPDNSHPSHEPLPGLSALFVDDCRATEQFRFSPEAWTDIERAENSKNLMQAVKRIKLALGKSQLQQAFHVAVDRWTGGAADGFLYSVLEPHGLKWKKIVIRFNLNRLHKEKRWAGIAFLLLVLRDLARGHIPLGFGVNRGMGAVKVNSVSFDVNNSDEDLLQKLTGISLHDGKLVIPDPDLKSALTSSWIAQINNVRKEGA
jgi:CRISPR/Cas system CSM-associated protein Csm3 (group 7 of RAMP superfamily)